MCTQGFSYQERRCCAALDGEAPANFCLPEWRWTEGSGLTATDAAISSNEYSDAQSSFNCCGRSFGRPISCGILKNAGWRPVRSPLRHHRAAQRQQPRSRACGPEAEPASAPRRAVDMHRPRRAERQPPCRGLRRPGSSQVCSPGGPPRPVMQDHQRSLEAQPVLGCIVPGMERQGEGHVAEERVSGIGEFYRSRIGELSG